MGNAIIKKSMQNKILKSIIKDSNTIFHLQEKIDKAEKDGRKKFSDFTDVEMIEWFLYRRQFLDPNKERTRRTVEEYKREIMMFVEHIITYAEQINIDIDQIIEGSLFKSLQSRHLRRYQEWLATKSEHVKKHGKYSPATLERKTTILKAFFRFLYEEDYIEEPVYKGFLITSVRKDDRPNRDLGPQEVVKLLDLFKEADHPVMFAIIHVLTTTGIRNEEFCTLQIKDFKKDTIHGGYYLDVLGKGNKRRQIPLKNKVVESIHTFRKARGLRPVELAHPEDPLFTTSTGKPFSPSYLSQYVRSQIEKLDAYAKIDATVQLTPHVFRHAFAIISKLNGVDVYDIMRSLGHEKIETTMIYLEKVFAKERHAIHAWQPEMFGEYI